MKVQLLDTMEWGEIIQMVDSEFGEGVCKTLLGDKAPVALVDREVKNIYLIPTAWINYLQMDIPEGFEYHLMGKQLGVITKGNFRLSLQILQEFVKLTSRVLVVSEHGAEAFTYGRSILRESIISIDSGLKRGERVLVVNKKHDCLGIAALSVDASRIDRLSKDSLVGKNLVDIGWFIRRLG
jgi:ribosome biogenesis protein Nip4